MMTKKEELLREFRRHAARCPLCAVQFCDHGLQLAESAEYEAWKEVLEEMRENPEYRWLLEKLLERGDSTTS